MHVCKKVKRKGIFPSLSFLSRDLGRERRGGGGGEEKKIRIFKSYILCHLKRRH